MASKLLVYENKAKRKTLITLVYSLVFTELLVWPTSYFQILYYLGVSNTPNHTWDQKSSPQGNFVKSDPLQCVVSKRSVYDRAV